MFTKIRLLSPVSFLIATLGFFLTFTDINCNGQKLDSVSGFEFVKGYNSDLEDSGNEAGATEKYSPNLFLLLAFLAGILGFIFYFIRKMKLNYGLMTITGLVGVLGLIGFMIDLKHKISSIDPDTNLDTNSYVNLEAEMKFGYWLVLFCFILATAWNWMKGKELEKRKLQIPEDKDDGIPEINLPV